VKESDIVLNIPIAQDLQSGKYTAVLPDISIRAMVEAEKKYNPTGFPTIEAVNGRKWAEWGMADNLPNFIHTRFSGVPSVMKMFKDMVSDIYGKGLCIVKKKDYWEGNFIKCFDPAVERFFTDNYIKTDWFPRQSFNRLLFYNSFSQMDLSVDRKQITNIYHQDAMWSRLGKQNPNTWEIDWHHYSGKFGSMEVPNDNEITSLPLINKFRKDAFFKKLRGSSFVWHTKAINAGTTYYSRPFWLALLNPKSWLDVVANVPRIVFALQNNQAVIRYVMRVSRDYFKFRHLDWESFGDKKRESIIEQFEKKIQDSLTGVDNPGKLVTFYLAEENGKFVGTIELVALDDKIKQDAWIPSSSVGNIEIANAIGFHASQFSSASDNGKMQSSSGADALIHFNSGVMRNTIEQMEILEPLQFIFDYNGWDYVVCVDDFAQENTQKQAAPSGENPNQAPKTNPKQHS
jgi:hypothetical protein